MKTEILKNNGNVSDVANKYDENGNLKWFLELQTEIMKDGIEWNIYICGPSGTKELVLNNNYYDVTKFSIFEDKNRKNDPWTIESDDKDISTQIIESFKTINNAEKFIKNFNLNEAVESIIDDIEEVVSKLEAEDEALESNIILEGSINQALNEIRFDGSVNETTIEEIETNISLAEESRNKIELGTDIDTQLRFTIQKANRILQDS